MTHPCPCRACGHVNDVEWSQIGKEISCGGCGKAMTVPAPREAVGPTPVPMSVLRFACPACGRKFATKPQMAGKKIRCSGCGGGVYVPQGAESSVVPASRSATDLHGSKGGAAPSPRPARAVAAQAGGPSSADDGSGVGLGESSDLLDELAALEGGKRRRRAEPVLPSRAEVMEQVRQKAAEQQAVETEKKAEKAKKKKKKKRKNSGYFDPKDVLQLVGGVGAFVGVLTFLAWGYPDLRFPLGGLLCILGFIVYALGAYSLKQLAAEEGPLQGVMFRFIPPYQWYFVATHWADAKDFVAFFGAGAVILSLGGAVIKTSEVGKRAEKSEAAYQKIHQGDTGSSLPPAMPPGDAGEED